jgi:hypothetical protein
LWWVKGEARSRRVKCSRSWPERRVHTFDLVPAG